jgi:hypothetical protein
MFIQKLKRKKAEMWNLRLMLSLPTSPKEEDCRKSDPNQTS